MKRRILGIFLGLVLTFSTIAIADSGWIGVEAILNKVFDSTNDALQVTTSGTIGTPVFSIPVTNPAGSEDFLIWRAPVAITITAVNGVCMDGTNLTCQINECDANGDNAVEICSDTAVTVSNTALTITNAVVDAGDYISFTSSAETGDVTKMMLSVEYTVN